MSLAIHANPDHVNTHSYAQQAAAGHVKSQSLGSAEARTAYLTGQSVLALLAEVMGLGQQYVGQIALVRGAASMLDQQLHERALEVFAKKLESARAELSAKLSMLSFFNARDSIAEYLAPVTKLLSAQIDAQPSLTSAYENNWQRCADVQQQMSAQLAQVNRLGLDIYHTLTKTLMPLTDEQNGGANWIETKQLPRFLMESKGV